MGLLEQRNQTKKLGNKGMSMIEILVVVAILAIVAAGTVSVAGLINSGDAKKAARTFVTDFNDLKNKTLSIYGDWHCEVENVNDFVTISTFRNGDLTSSNRIGSRVEVSFSDGTSEYDLYESDKLTLNYSQGTGAIVTAKIGDVDLMDANPTYGTLKVSSGNIVYTLKIYYKTGKIVADI